MLQPLKSHIICIVWYASKCSEELRIDCPLRVQNMLRKRTYWDHYGPLDDTYQRDPDFYRLHIGQCSAYLHRVSYF